MGTKKGEYVAEAHADRIMGCHIDEYMDKLKGPEGSEELYNKQFSKWDACLKKCGCETVETLFEKIHEGIRSTPVNEKKKRTKTAQTYTDAIKTKTGQYKRDRKIGHAKRKANLEMKLEIARNS